MERLEKLMRAFEYARESNMKDLEPIQQQFTAKMILKEVQKIAKEHGIDEETAYWAYMHGLYDGDRKL